ncbi:CLUMA_CG009313, isoform A [Clunio marinus]|uniref:CLUMA_CG009313, isoform A n=1 Tax=Clunio marinus TaxID=568069 RepID=A0A1J1I802_9DIPT|nr:CLUMA_CG009313, isoform A [Clunio marinus]
MFNSLFNSLFGKSNKDNNSTDLDENSGDTDKTQQGFSEADSNVTAIILDEDKDWLFVEKEVESDTISIEATPKNLQLVPFKSIFTNLGSINETDENSFLSANLPSLFPNSMDDSWFLTPPECFSSVSSIQLESSPLENLLIEHPSMSVYYNFRKRGSLTAITNGNVIDDLVVLEMSQNDIEEEQAEKVSSNKRGKRNKKSRSTGVQNTVSLVLVKKNNNAQKSQDPRRTNPGKTAFERNNKCYALRHAPKRTTVINQPSSRMMMINKKN